MMQLYCLTDDPAERVDLDALAVRLRDFFAGQEGFSIAFDDGSVHPRGPHLVLTWGSDWRMEVFIDDHEHVLDDSRYIAEKVPADRRPGIAALDWRIAVLFDDDPNREHTDESVDMMQFLEEIPRAVVYDVNQDELVE
jgi:hypothetical protein